MKAIILAVGALLLPTGVVEASKDDPLSLSITEVFWGAGGIGPARYGK